MAGEDEGDAHTLGLLLDMRELCTRIAEEHHGYAAQLHDLVRQIQNPNVHGLDKEMGFRIEDIGDGELPSINRAISLNCSAEVAHGAFAAATKAYPNRRMRLKWGAYIIETYEPKKIGA